MAKTTTRTETAPEAYSRIAAEINAQIRNLEFRLQIHAGSHRDRPTDRGLVGDLGHVRELLQQIHAFLAPPADDDVQCDHADGCCRKDVGKTCDDTNISRR